MTKINEMAKLLEQIPLEQREAIMALLQLVLEEHYQKVLLLVETQKEVVNEKLKASKEIADATSAISSLRFAAICWVVGTCIAIVAAALRFVH